MARGISPLEEALRSPSEPAEKCESISNYFDVDLKSTLTNSFLGAGSVFFRKLGSAFGPYGSNHDSVTCCNNNGGNDKQNQRNQYHVELPMPLFPKFYPALRLI